MSANSFIPRVHTLVAIPWSRRYRRRRLALFLLSFALSATIHVAALSLALFLYSDHGILLSAPAPSAPFELLDSRFASPSLAGPSSAPDVDEMRFAESPATLPLAGRGAEPAEAGRPDAARLDASRPAVQERAEGESAGAATDPDPRAPTRFRSDAAPALADLAPPSAPPATGERRVFVRDFMEMRFDAMAVAPLTAAAGHAGGLDAPPPSTPTPPAAINPQPELEGGGGVLSALVRQRPVAAARDASTAYPAEPDRLSMPVVAAAPGGGGAAAAPLSEIRERRFAIAPPPPRFEEAAAPLARPLPESASALFGRFAPAYRRPDAAAETATRAEVPDLAVSDAVLTQRRREAVAAPRPSMPISAASPDIAPPPRALAASGDVAGLVPKRRRATPIGGFNALSPRVSPRQGRATLSAAIAVKINERGVCETVRLVRSSGYPALDQMAMSAARRQIYRPAIAGGLPVTSEEIFVIPF